MTKKAKYSYIGEKYRQGTSNMELISFCATANDIYEWGGVPAKTERFHGGFQRALSDRHKSIKRFFDDGQASPTSIVVAFREGVLQTLDLGHPPGWPAEGNLAHVPQFVHLTFEFDDFSEDSDLSELRTRVCDLLRPRLDASPEEPIVFDDPTDEESNEQDNEEPDADEDDGNGYEDTSDELDVGHSKLKSFYDFIADDGAVEEWLTNENSRYDELRKKSRLSIKEKSFVEFTPEQRLKSVLISLLRPATIVDGQHRVWGAYYSDESPILFNVCAIRDTSWIEQVFQFVVLNKLAKPISTSFLTGLLNTSLTNSEVKVIEDRLETIGVKNTERRIMKYLNHDERSPFYGMVAEAGEVAGVDNVGKLSDKGMIRLAKRWRQIRGPKLEISMFASAIGASNLTDARRRWREYETWFPFFYAFWEEIRAKYEKDGIWEKSEDYALLYIVTMHAMQDLFLDTKARATVTFADQDDFRSQVSAFFEDVPSTFFQGWKATGLQSGEGPEYIKSAIEALRSGSKLSSVKRHSFLFQEPKKN